jgi:hypothetical protein
MSIDEFWKRVDKTVLMHVMESIIRSAAKVSGNLPHFILRYLLISPGGL